MQIKIESEALKAALKRKMGVKGLKLGLAAAALEVAGKFKQVPPESHRPQSQYWSAKQRRGFFYHLNKGDIEVPYRRGMSRKSQKLSQSWTTEARNDGLVQVIGTAVSYAPRVQMAGKQAQYHKVTGWKTEDTIAKEQEPRVQRTVEYYIEKDL